MRDKQMYPTAAGYDAENLVSNALRDQAHKAQADAIATAGTANRTSEIADGPTWKAAFDSLHWLDAELLVLGLSKLGALNHVFLGSNASKIVHNSPVPCLILPRAAE